MRFKILQTLMLTASALYVIHLGLTRSLNYYIHPRYIIFTLTMSLIALVLVFMNFGSKTHVQTTANHGSKLSLLPLIIILIFAFGLPEKSLTTATISQRSIDSGLQSTTGNGGVATTFSGSSRGLKLSDWSRLLGTHDDPGFYATKPAKISGIVYDAGLGSDTVWIARFVLTCCAVDAQPIGVPVRIEGWRESFAQNQWLEVEGIFQLQQTDQGEKIVLVPESVTPIEEPGNPYAN